MPSVLQQARKQPHTTKIIKPLKLSSNEPQLPEMLESEPSATGLHQDANPSSRSVHRNRRRCLSADQVILLMTKSSDESDTADSDELLPSDRPNEATGSTRPQSPLSHLMDPQTE
ncbi:hypothetical protein RRG08_007250 [Elysia crispata]|uniref:Uncharacterized protein n=1 Tax=Elysia crispata TaxID=231223 RepID=A0AAE0ZTT6_9GAST|nr:hypothetical protein RRG08_007250 [Elysia crispata]